MKRSLMKTNLATALMLALMSPDRISSASRSRLDAGSPDKNKRSMDEVNRLRVAAEEKRARKNAKRLHECPHV